MQSSSENSTSPDNGERFAFFRSFIGEYIGLTLVLVLLVIVFGLMANNFFTRTTFLTIANQIPDITIIAVGMTFVLIIAGIDLSVGSVMALSGAVFGVMLNPLGMSLPLPVAIFACLGTGLLCGVFNGAVVVNWKLPSFIVTLGMLEIARGGAFMATGSRTMYLGAPVEAIAQASLFGLSLPFITAFSIVVLGQFILTRTVYGRYLIAIGTNEEALRLSGVDPRPLKFSVFALCSTLTAVAAIFHTARLSSANPNAGSGLELQAIAAVVIGGTSLMGGRGSVISTFFGVLIIAVLNTGLSQLGAQESTRRLVTGAVIVAAVILDYYRNRMRRVEQA